MEKDKDIVLDSTDFEEDDIITLTSDDGEEIDFYHEATIEYNNEWFVFLHPVEELEDISDDEVIIFKLVKSDNGEDVLDPIEDEELIEEVYAEYVKLIETYDEDDDEDDDDDEED